VSLVDGVWLKREDLFSAFNANGGKARACLGLAATTRSGLITAAARKSPQGVITAAIARGLSIECRIHTASGVHTPEILQAIGLGAEVVQHRPGYSSVIQARARADAADRGWTLIPFGMEAQESIDLTAPQVSNIPSMVKRLVVPVGSGMTLAAILWGLCRRRRELPIAGVVVGANPRSRLNQWAPSGWEKRVTLVAAKTSYARVASQLAWGEVSLDPNYEAKCIPFLRQGDCLWIVGHRALR
jgi:threonine dehydratase